MHQEHIGKKYHVISYNHLFELDAPLGMVQYANAELTITDVAVDGDELIGFKCKDAGDYIWLKEYFTFFHISNESDAVKSTQQEKAIINNIINSYLSGGNDD